MLFKPKKFGIVETTIRLNRLYDKNTTVLQKWREKEPSGSLPPSSVRLPTPVSACPSLCDYRPVPAFWCRSVQADLQSGAAVRPAPTRALLSCAEAHGASMTEFPDVP